MKFSCLIVISVASIIFAGCKKHDDEGTPAKKTLFTLKVSKPTNNDDNYVVIHNAQGLTIGYRAYESGETITFDTLASLASDTIAVTLFDYHTTQGFYSAYTYFGIPAGEIWTLANEENHTAVKTGAVTFVLTHDARPQLISITNELSKLGSVGSITDDENHSTVTADLADGRKSLFMGVRTATGDFLSKQFDNLNDGDTIELDISDLEAVEKVVTFNFPTAPLAFLTVYGRTATQDFSENGFQPNYQYGNDLSKFSAPYPADLRLFTTDINLIYGSHSIYYTLQGDIPENIEWPDASSFIITSNDIRDFRATASIPFKYRNSGFGNDIIGWGTLSKSLTNKLVDFPPALLSKNPKLSFDQLTSNGTSFYSRSTISYEEQLAIRFKSAAKPGMYEQLILTK